MTEQAAHWFGLGAAEWQAVALSLKVAFWAALLSLPLGIFVAYALARWRFAGREVLNGLVHLPLILPPVVTGYLLLMTFGARAPIGAALKEIGIVFAFRWSGAALAAAIMGFPLMVRAIRLSIEAIDPKLEEAATSLGPSRCPWPCPVCSPEWFWPLPRLWANLARRSPLSPTFLVKPARCPRPSTRSYKCPAAKARRCDWW